MNFTILSAAMEKSKNPNVPQPEPISEVPTSRFRVEMVEGVECLVDDSGKRYAIWALLEDNQPQQDSPQEIAELFDRPFPYRMVRGGFGKVGDNVGVFSVDSSKNDEVEVELTFRDSRLFVNFLRGDDSREKTMELTGQGSAERVLATVMQMIEKFLESADVSQVVIVTMKEENDSRQRVYRRLIGRYAQKMGYAAQEKHNSFSELWFILNKNN